MDVYHPQKLVVKNAFEMKEKIFEKTYKFFLRDTCLIKLEL